MSRDDLLGIAKPILFNTEMVQAILEGRKTVTRRCVKPQPAYSPNDGFSWKGVAYGTDLPPTIKGAAYNFRCAAQYQPGDVLYVRETWEHFDCCSCEGDEHGNCPKEPQKNVLDKYGCGCYMYRASDDIWGDAKWRPSIHMPKEAARIWLRVKDVRVERLQDITDEEAKREGSQPQNPFDYDVNKWPNKEHFKEIWNSTIKKSDLDRYGWDASPWVWVIEFERILPD